jgi:hypothetical protein
LGRLGRFPCSRHALQTAVVSLDRRTLSGNRTRYLSSQTTVPTVPLAPVKDSKAWSGRASCSPSCAGSEQPGDSWADWDGFRVVDMPSALNSGLTYILDLADLLQVGVELRPLAGPSTWGSRTIVSPTPRARPPSAVPLGDGHRRPARGIGAEESRRRSRGGVVDAQASEVPVGEGEHLLGVFVFRGRSWPSRPPRVAFTGDRVRHLASRDSMEW